MPRAPLKPCQQVGCNQRVARGYCEHHQKRRPPPGQARINTHRALYGRKWERARRLFLMDHPLCVDCSAHGRTTPATEVDHITPHKGDFAIFWNCKNWQALCKSCHSRKTAREDGGFANDRR